TLRIGRDEQKPAPENVMKNPDYPIKNGGLEHIVPGNRQDVADQHVFQVLSFSGGFAHGQDGGGGCNCIGYADESFLRDVTAPGARESKDRSTYESEAQAKPVSTSSMRVHANENGDSSAQGGNLRQREINEYHSAFHNVDTQICMNTGENQTGHKR